MPPEAPFQYALLRLVPRADRGECVNVGVVLFARTRDYLGLRTVLEPGRARALDPALDLDAVRRRLAALERVARGDPAAGPIARLPRHERFGWLTAPSSTVIRPSSVHTGLCADPEGTLAGLLARLVA